MGLERLAPLFNEGVEGGVFLGRESADHQRRGAFGSLRACHALTIRP